MLLSKYAISHFISYISNFTDNINYSSFSEEWGLIIYYRSVPNTIHLHFWLHRVSISPLTAIPSTSRFVFLTGNTTGE